MAATHRVVQRAVAVLIDTVEQACEDLLRVRGQQRRAPLRGCLLYLLRLRLSWVGAGVRCADHFGVAHGGVWCDTPVRRPSFT